MSPKVSTNVNFAGEWNPVPGSAVVEIIPRHPQGGLFRTNNADAGSYIDSPPHAGRWPNSRNSRRGGSTDGFARIIFISRPRSAIAQRTTI